MGYVLRRGGVAIGVLLLAVTLNFGIVRFAPGDYTNFIAAGPGRAPSLTDEDRASLRREFGIDGPLYEQFARYLARTVQGDFGVSFTDGQPVTSRLWTAAQNSVPMVFFGLLGGVLFGIMLGTIAAVLRGSWIDSAIVTLASLVYALPAQWIGMVLLAALAGPFPVGGREDPFLIGASRWEHYQDVLLHMVLPASTLAIVTFGAYALIVRSSVLAVLRQDFVITAVAKGFSTRRIVMTEIMRNAFLPILALAALTLGSVFGGALLIEVVFSWPGLGSLAYNSIVARDYPVIQGTFLVLTAGVVIANLAADLLYSRLDPRIDAG